MDLLGQSGETDVLPVYLKQRCMEQALKIMFLAIFVYLTEETYLHILHLHTRQENEKNKKLPEQIFNYPGGQSEGNFPYFLKYDL